MLTIRPTKMLARRLGIELPAAIPVVPNRLADWCAIEFRASRYRYVMFCQTATLYPVVMSARGVVDESRLVYRLLGGLKTCLEGTPLEFRFHQLNVPEMTEVQFVPIPGKSILGSMNDLVWAAKVHLETSAFTPPELSQRLAETPMSALGMNSPDRAFANLQGGR